MEPWRTLGGVTPGDLDRVAALERNGLAAALREPHDASVENIYRGNHLELT
jgi:hypothetical protein